MWSKKLHYKFVESAEDGDFMLALNAGEQLRTSSRNCSTQHKVQCFCSDPPDPADPLAQPICQAVRSIKNRHSDDEPRGGKMVQNTVFNIVLDHQDTNSTSSQI